MSERRCAAEYRRYRLGDVFNFLRGKDESNAFSATLPRDSIGEPIWPVHALEVRISRLTPPCPALVIPLPKFCAMQMPDYVRVGILSFSTDFPNQLPAVMRKWLEGEGGEIYAGSTLRLLNKEIRPSAMLGADVMSLAAFKPESCVVYGFGFASATQLILVLDRQALHSPARRVQLSLEYSRSRLPCCADH